MDDHFDDDQLEDVLYQPARPGTEEQKEFLLSYMERNTLFARGKARYVTAHGIGSWKEKWTYLCRALNDVPGGAVKTATKWVKVSSLQRNFFLGVA